MTRRGFESTPTVCGHALLGTFVLCVPLLACDSIGAAATGSAQPAAPLPSTHDWPTFNRDINRSGASPDPTGITAANVASMQRQQVPLDGTVDASPIYLHGVSSPNGAVARRLLRHDDLRQDDRDRCRHGVILWRFTPAGSTRPGGLAADHDRDTCRRSESPVHLRGITGRTHPETRGGGRPRRLEHGITQLPSARRSPVSLDTSRAGSHRRHRRLYRRRPAVSGTRRNPRRGDGPPRARLELALQRPHGTDQSARLPTRATRRSGAARARSSIRRGNIFVATGNAKWDGKTNWGDATIELDPTATRMLGNYTPSNTES